jgi:Kef-type K+ transport system membrane component KefB
MMGIALLIGAAAIGFGLSQWLRVPAIPLLLLGGVGLSFTGLLPPPQLLEYLLVLGLSVLVFIGGTELNPRRVRAQQRAALGVGAVQFLCIGGAGFGLALLLGYAVQVALYIALALSASSTLVVVRLLQNRKQLFEPFGRLVLGVLLLQDLAIILLIPVIGRLEDGLAAMLAGVLAALALVLLSWVLLRWVTPVLLGRFHLDDETLLLAILSLLFIFIGIADVFGLPIIAGAFLAGVSLSAFPAGGLVRGQLTTMSDFFTAIFFTALGAILTLPTLLELSHALLFGLVVVVVTPPLVTAIAERYGLSARSALESGLLLAQCSEFSLVVALQGLVAGHIGPGVFTVIALVTGVTMVLTPFYATDGVTWSLLRFHPVRRAATRSPTAPEGHVLLLGCGENGMPLLETLHSAGVHVVVVDDDPAVIAQLREADIHAVRGDGSDWSVLHSAGAQRARLIVSTIRRPLDNEAVLRYARGVPTLVRVFEDIEAARIEELGGQAIIYSEAAADDFLRWYEQAMAGGGIEQERRTRPR